MIYVDKNSDTPSKAKGLFDFHLVAECDALVDLVSQKLNISLDQERKDACLLNQKEQMKLFLSHLEKTQLGTYMINQEKLVKCKTFLTKSTDNDVY